MNSKAQQLGFFSLISIAAAGAISGVFSSIGLATEETGRSAWMAYALAALVGGFLRVIPTLMFTSMFRYKGGNYTMAAMTIGPLAGGIYALWWLPMFLSRGTSASALGQYIQSVFPSLSAKWTSVALVTIAFVINLFGVKAMAKVQRPLMALAVGALLLFTAFGLTKLQPGSFGVTSPEYYSGGGLGVLLAVTLVIQPMSAPALLCGFSWEAKNPRRNIPLAILAGSCLVTLIFVGVSFVAANTLPIGEIAGKPMTYAARQILPGVLFPAFLLLGPILALCSNLNASMSTISAPVLGAIRSGWLPRELGRNNRHGSPWIIYTAMWLICTVPLVLGVSLKTFAAYTVMTQRISGLLLLAVAFRLPTRFPRQWDKSFWHMPKKLYYLLLALSGAAEIATLLASAVATSLPVFVGNLCLAGLLAAYAVSRYKSGKTKSEVQAEDFQGDFALPGCQ